MTMRHSFSLENYLWASFEPLDDGGFFQWGFIFALAACLGTVPVLDFFLNHPGCVNLGCKPPWGLVCHCSSSGDFLSFIIVFGAGAVGFVFDSSLHQGFILILVLWDLSRSPSRLWALCSVPTHLLRPWQPRLRVARFATCLQCPVHFWVPIFTKILA